MKSHKILLFLVLFLTACTESDKKDLEAKKKELADDKTKVKELTAKIETLEKDIAKIDTGYKIEQKSKLIEIEPLKKQDFKHYIEVQGNVDAEENITALPQQPGLVTQINVKVGDHVTKGQLLGLTATTATIDDQLAGAQIQYNLAVTAYEKQKTLWDQQIGSEIQFLQAKTQKESAEKNIDALKQQLQMTKIISPINGIVDAVNLRVGDMAAPSQLMPGIRIVNGESLKVKAKLADSDFGKIKEGDNVVINFPDIDKTIVTPVTFVSHTIDPRSRTYGIEAKISNNANIFAMNMIARLKINDEIYKNVLVVPSNVIQKSADGNYILVASEENGMKIAHKRMVQTGADYNGQTIITSGLNEGDLVITFGYSEVVDGQKINY